MLKIEVDSDQCEVINYKDKKTLEPKQMIKQTLYWHKTGMKYPVEFNVMVPQNEQALAVGMYNLDFDALADVDRFGSLSINSFAVYETLKASTFKKVA